MRLRLLLVLFITLSSGFGSLLSDLDSSQSAELNSGQMVVKTEDVTDAPWPRLRVYTKVDAPVSVVEKLLRDYGSASSYTPGLKSAEVLAQPTPDTYKVCYTSSMPLVGDTKSTVLNQYSKVGDALVVNWKLVQADLADESTGELRVEPAPDGGSILRYTNFVRPKSSFAKLAKSAAVSEVKKTVAAIKSESEKRSKQPAS
jgi:hypothetical protein